MLSNEELCLKSIRHVSRALKNTHFGGRGFDTASCVGKTLEGMIDVESVPDDFPDCACWKELKKSVQSN